MQPNRIKRQQLVRLNVGQTPFSLLRESIDRYPNSLLAKLIEEYSDLVANGEYLYIDRHPKSFPWIAEIYRDGDFKGNLPDMSSKELKKELRFYGLPSLSKLGIQSTRDESPILCGDTSPITSLFLQVLSEITRSGLLYFLPVDVFIYREVKEGPSEGSEIKKLVVPHGEMGANYISHRDHGAFAFALLEGKQSSCLYSSWGKKLITQKGEFWLLDFTDDAKLTLMNREAKKCDMRCTTYAQSYGSVGNELTVSVLKLEFRSPWIAQTVVTTTRT